MKVIAHRGYCGKYPENTMLAFKKAVEAGCDEIELDVQLTKDGKVVVIHDETIDRVTNGSGLVRDYTLEELQKFHAGSVFGDQYGFVNIPSFEEYCQWAAGQKVTTNIELKTGIFYYEELEEKTIEIIRKYGLEEKVMFSSFNPLSLIEAKRIAPEIPCGFLVDAPLGNAGYYCKKYGFEFFHPNGANFNPLSLIEAKRIAPEIPCGFLVDAPLGNAGYYCKKYGFEFFHPNGAKLTQEAWESCKKHGVGINAWTINDMGVLEKLYDWDCAGAITNYPNVVKAWIDSQK